jgi:hypothetical protein
VKEEGKAGAEKGGHFPPSCPPSSIRLDVGIGWGRGMKKSTASYLHDQLKPFSRLYFLHQVPGHGVKDRRWRRKGRNTITVESHRDNTKEPLRSEEGGVESGRGPGTLTPTG